MVMKEERRQAEQLCVGDNRPMKTEVKKRPGGMPR